MRTRDAVLDYQKTIKDTETYEKDLDLTEPISALDLEVECTNGATSNKGNFISDIVTKAEIVDGSETLGSLNMSQLESMHFCTSGRMPALFPSEWGGGIQRHAVRWFFGRWLWDPEYSFLATKFKNAQLKVTMNKAAIRAAGDTGFASGDNIKLTAVAKVSEDLPAPTKYLMTKQKESFTSTSGEKRIELPVDYTYRMLLFRFWKQGSDIDEIISEIKFTLDTDRFIPLNRKVKQLDAQALAEFGMGELKHDMFASDSEEVRLLFNKEPVVALWNWETPMNVFCNMHWAWSSQCAPAVFLHDGTAYGTDVKLTSLEKGHALHATLPVPFGRLDVPGDWFDPTPFKKMELVLTQATADATCEIVTQQVRPL